MLLDALVGRRRLAPSSALDQLTPREMDVLREMAQGRSNAAIAGRLHLSESSIEKHVGSVFGKLGVGEGRDLHRRVAAVVAYLKATGG